MTTTIARWGNSLAVRIPRSVLTEANLAEGDQVVIASEEGKLVMVRAAIPPNLDELIARISPENRHGESFSVPVGRERE